MSEFILSRKLLAECLPSFRRASDPKHPNHAYAGLHFVVTDGRLEMYATDGFRLAWQELDVPSAKNMNSFVRIGRVEDSLQHVSCDSLRVLLSKDGQDMSFVDPETGVTQFSLQASPSFKRVSSVQSLARHMISSSPAIASARVSLQHLRKTINEHRKSPPCTYPGIDNDDTSFLCICGGEMFSSANRDIIMHNGITIAVNTRWLSDAASHLFGSASAILDVSRQENGYKLVVRDPDRPKCTVIMCINPARTRMVGTLVTGDFFRIPGMASTFRLCSENPPCAVLVEGSHSEDYEHCRTSSDAESSYIFPGRMQVFLETIAQRKTRERRMRRSH